MTSFADLFQRHVSSDSYIEFTIDEMLASSERSSIAQYPLNQSKVGRIVKSIIKDSVLYICPQQASFNGLDYTVGGRHRTAAADIICRTYGINAKGKPELYTEVNRQTLVPIERRMLVDYVCVDSMSTLAGLILASNGSRTMTAPESAAVKALGGYATPADKFKLRFAPYLAANLDLTDANDTPITISAVTLSQIGAKCYRAIKNLAAASDEQLNTLASHLNEYLCDSCSLPTTFAQHHAPYIAEFLDHSIELEDEDGNVLTQYDTQGEEIAVSYSTHFATLLPTVEKVAKAPKKQVIDAAKFEAMAKKLQELGITI